MTDLTPDDIRFVQYLARVHEGKAWDPTKPGHLPHKGHSVHALALRLACGQTREQARDYLARAKPPEAPCPSS